VTWTRHHEINRGVDVPGARVVVWVSIVDRYYGEGWEQRDKPTLTVQPGIGQFVRANRPDDVKALVALASLIEPMIMVVIGILIGGMVIGMYLPIFKLGAVVG
jgi:hypothetical protein